ncbi:unnamed protein product [Caenorhabditis brenneri]
MSLAIVIRLFLCLSPSASIINFVSSQQLKVGHPQQWFIGYPIKSQLEGSPEIGYLPEDAQKVCEKIGGTIATLTDDNRQFFTENLLKMCVSSMFCPKMCIWGRVSDKRKEKPKLVGNEKTKMTQPIFPGDTLHLKLEMEPNTVEVFQISDSSLENSLNSSTQTVFLQMTLFNQFTSEINGNRIMKTMTIKSEKITRIGNKITTDSTFSKHEISSALTMNGIIELNLEFTEQKTLKISSTQVFGDEIIEKSIGVSPSGRMYFRKFYDKSKVLDVYFTRGNCFKSDFHFYPGNSSDGYVNCLWTRPTQSIPVYSCRKASYVACEDIPSPTSTDTPTTSMNSKTVRTTRLPKSTTTTTTTTTTTKTPEPHYFHSEFLDDHILLFISLSGLSLGLLIGSIVLQIMKIWQNRNVKNLNTEKSIEGSPCSLMRFTVEERLKEALQEEETVNEINEIIRTHPIDLSHLHFFEDKPELLKIAFENSYSEKLGIFGLELRSSTCILTVERKYIAEIPVSETLEEAKYYINLAVAKGYLKFRLSVTEHPIGNETRRQKLERITEEIEKEYNREANECSIGCYIQRGFHFEKGTGSHIYFSKYVGKDDGICRHVKIIDVCLPEIRNYPISWDFANALTKNGSKKSPEFLLKLAYKSILHECLEYSEIENRIEQILKTNHLEINRIHSFEAHPQLLITALRRSFPISLNRYEIEIWNQSCRLILFDEVVAVIPTTEFEWPIQFLQLAFEKSVPNVQISVMESQCESISSKCKRFSREFVEETTRMTPSECSIECYSKREIYYDGSLGSHIQLTRIVSDTTGLCHHLAERNNGDQRG